MNPEIKEKWVAALRSGEYKQGHGALKNKQNEYCCLGVLCDLYFKETGDGGWYEDKTTESRNCYSFLNHTGILSFAVTSWSGLNSDNGVLSDFIHAHGTRYESLAALNDSTVGFSFEQIAEVIEDQF